jgi:hypothetical protein
VVRVVYRPPGYARVGILILLLVWAVLFGYLEADTNPPPLATILLLFPLLALAWTLSLISRETIWETDDAGIRKTFGRKTTAGMSWSDVGKLFVKGGPQAPNPTMLVVGKDGSRKMKIVAGVGLDLQGLRTLYQSASAYLRVHDVEGKNPFGWPNTHPLARTVETRSLKPNWLAHVGVGLSTSGITTLLGAMQQGSVVTSWLGAAITLAGIAMMVVAFLRSKRSLPAPAKPPAGL